MTEWKSDGFGGGPSEMEVGGSSERSFCGRKASAMAIRDHAEGAERERGNEGGGSGEVKRGKCSRYRDCLVLCTVHPALEAKRLYYIASQVRGSVA